MLINQGGVSIKYAGIEILVDKWIGCFIHYLLENDCPLRDDVQAARDYHKTNPNRGIRTLT